jgi:ABC-type antimicrobial peptide transport system permease subunit
MNAVWMRARNELRSRWRALLSLALIAGLGGGVAIAALAGARRTVSVYPRFRAATHAFDDLIGVNGNTTPSDAEQTAILSSVKSLRIIDSSITDAYAGEIVGPSGVVQTFPDVFIVGGPDGKLGTTLDAMKLEGGRYADPTRTDEVTVSSIEAAKLGARVGSTLTLRFPSVTYTLHVVGIGVVAGSVDPATAAYTPVVIVTPAFYAQNDAPGQRQGPTLAVRVRGGLAGVSELEKELAAVTETRIRAAKTPGEKQAAENEVINSTITAAPQNDSVRRTALFEGVGLAIFGGLALLTVLAIFGQLLARQIFLETDEQDALRALGMSRSQLFGLSFLRVCLVGLGACVVSIVIAIIASPLFPIGFMHRLEVSPGVRVDAFAITVGAAGILALILLAGLIPALRASAAKGKSDASVGTNRTANVLAAAAFPPTAVAGVRMALEPGHGSTAVPVRTTIFGTVLALAALIAALTFGAGLQHMVSTPSLSGWNFDAILPGNSAPPGPDDPFPKVEQELRSSPVVQSFALGTFPTFDVKGIFMDGFAFAAGPFGPSIAAGRQPVGTGEIAFGVKTLRALHTSIGKTIQVNVVDPNTSQLVTKPVLLRIVGAVVTPQFFFTQYSANYSAVVSQEFVDSFHIPGVRPGGDTFYVRFRPGVSVDAALQKIRGDLPQGVNPFILKRSTTSDLANLDHIASLPNLLAALLGLVAAGTLAHTLISSVRRRRRDLAVLRALGFVRRQVGMTVAWQATTIAIISLAIGLPLGAIAGRLAWRFFVSQLGYVPVTIVPILGIVLAVPAAIILANMIAGIPARAAARTEPAVVLRAE